MRLILSLNEAATNIAVTVLDAYCLGCRIVFLSVRRSSQISTLFSIYVTAPGPPGHPGFLSHITRIVYQ